MIVRDYHILSQQDFEMDEEQVLQVFCHIFSTGNEQIKASSIYMEKDTQNMTVNLGPCF